MNRVSSEIMAGPQQRDRPGPVCGIMSVVLFIIGMSIGLAKAPDAGHGGGAAAVHAFYASAGNRHLVDLAAYLLALSGAAFVVFLVSLYRRLQQAEGERGTLAPIALAGGLLYVGLLLVCCGAVTSTALAMAANAANPSGELAGMLAQLGWAIVLVPGAFAAIASILATSALTLKTNVLPRWTAYLGFVVAILLIAAYMFIPFFAILVWIAAISLSMLAQPAGVPVARSEGRDPSLRTERAS